MRLRACEFKRKVHPAELGHLANGLSTNASDWWPLPNSAATNTASITTTTNVDDYYRLVYP